MCDAYVIPIMEDRLSKIKTDCITEFNVKYPDIEKYVVTTKTKISVSHTHHTIHHKFISEPKAHTDYINKLKDYDSEI